MSRLTRRLPLLDQLESRLLLSTLVKDIVTAPAAGGSTFSRFAAVVGGNLFYAGYSNLHGEIYMTDGTAAGTVAVSPGGPSNCNNLVNANGILYFAGNDGTSGAELWRSDGTLAGTYMLKDIAPGSNRSDPVLLTNVNGTLYFIAANSTSGGELWKSDGTAAGTVMVKDIVPGASSPNITLLTAVGNMVYFIANDGTNGTELWKSDGTAAGTVLVKDIRAGANSSSPNNLTNVNGVLYFTANDGTNFNELWRSDGTAGGTTMVADINVGSTSSPSNLVNVNGLLYFSASNGSVVGTELWKSDGTAAGTLLVKDIRPGAGGSSPSMMTNVDGTLFFLANDAASGAEIWKSDGTDSGTVLVKDILPGAGHPSVNNMSAVGTSLFFTADDGTGKTLWKSDGSAAGTVIVKPIAADGPQNSFGQILNLNGIALFTAQHPTMGSDIWRSDGTAAGTYVVQDIATGTQGFSSTNVLSSEAIDNTFYFSIIEDNYGAELWKSDGTAAGTSIVKDIAPGNNTLNGWSSPNLLTNVNGTLFFTADDGTTGTEVWKSNGTAAGTVLLKDILTGSNDSTPLNLYNYNGRLVFSATANGSGRELWISNGTTATTTLLKDINPGVNSSYPFNFFEFNGSLYFSANDGFNGTELWKSNGTAAGTALFKNINATANHVGSVPAEFTEVNGTIFFTANDGVNGTEIWKSDGTVAGTVLVKDIRSGSNGSSPYMLTNLNGTLFFVAYDGVSGGGLWRSNGTAAGTTLVKNVDAMGGMTTLGNWLIFANNTAANGIELWRSDGTTAGTVLVKDINPGAGHGFKTNEPAKFVDVNGSLYFQANDGTNGNELWKTDGTAAGTVLVENFQGRYNSNANPLAAIGNSLAFVGDDGFFGPELRVESGAPIANAGGPYTIVEGGSLVLGSTGSAAAWGRTIASFAWDLDGNGDYADASGPNPTLTWAQLSALGLNDGPSVRSISLRVVDDVGNNATASATLILNNVPPTAAIAGRPFAIVGESFSFTLSATDPSPVDQAAVFNYQIDWTGDGVADETVNGAGSIVVTHHFSSVGTFAVTVRAADAEGTYGPASAPLAITVVDTSASVFLNGPDIDVVGTSAGDTIYIGQTGNSQFFVSINGASQGNWTTGTGGVIQIFGLASIDLVVLGGTNSADTFELLSGQALLNGIAIVGASVENWNYLGFGGDDTFTATGGTGAVIGGNGNDTLIGPSGDHRWNIHNSNLGDIDGIVWTFNGVENLTGGAGNDTFAFYGSAGLSAAVSGGAGVNTLNYENVASGVAVNLSTGLASNTGSIQNFQNVTGGTGDDSITGDGNSNTLQGNDGADTIDGAGGDDFVLGGTWVYSAADGNDVLYAGAGADTELGGAGDDEMHGGDGADLITGGYWDLYAAGGNNTIFGDDGDDQIEAGNGSDTVSGGAGNDTILGAFWDFSGPDGDDKLSGDDGADMILGGKGSDTIDGGAGDDKLFGGNFAGPLAGDGNDIVIGRVGADLVDGGNGKDFLIGGQDIDNIYGEADDDLIVTGDVNFGASESAALAAILAEWTSADDYDTRVGYISGISGGANDPYFLDSSTALADNAVDNVFGNDGLDWFVTDIADTIGDQNFPGPETRTDL